MELTDNDRQRIEQEALEALWEKMSREDWLAGEGFSGKMGGLTKIPTVCKPRIFEFTKEYATIYEREQQAKENERFKELLTYSEDRNTIYLSKIEQLEAERSELRNKVIEECIAKVNDRYGERISKATLIELLNSLKK